MPEGSNDIQHQILRELGEIKARQEGFGKNIDELKDTNAMLTTEFVEFGKQFIAIQQASQQQNERILQLTENQAKLDARLETWEEARKLLKYAGWGMGIVAASILSGVGTLIFKSLGG